MPPPRPDVFSYLDYREFLRDYYVFGKAKFGLSYRGLARRVGVKSPSFLKFVMESRRNLSPGTARRVAKACACEGEGVDFFVALTVFDQAEAPEERRAAYRELLRFEGFQKLRPLELARDAYHAHWYYPAIRELVASPAFDEDPKWIARALKPRIRASQAKKALTALQAMGLLKRDDDGRLRQVDEVVSSGAETGSIHLAAYHRMMMERGAASIDEFPREQRDISSITLCVDAEGLARLKEHIQLIRKELLLDESFAQGPPVQVVQLNFQLFPLSSQVTES